MNAYRPEASQHRAVFGAAAVALMALTFGLAIVIPAGVEPETQAAIATKSNAHVTEVAISPAVIEVILYRDRDALADRVRTTSPARQAPKGAHVVEAGATWHPAAASTATEWRCPASERASAT